MKPDDEQTFDHRYLLRKHIWIFHKHSDQVLMSVKPQVEYNPIQ